MLIIIRKPTNRESRIAAKIMAKGGREITRKEVDLVALDQNFRVIGVIQTTNGDKKYFSLLPANADLEEAVREKVAKLFELG